MFFGVLLDLFAGVYGLCWLVRLLVFGGFLVFCSDRAGWFAGLRILILTLSDIWRICGLGFLCTWFVFVTGVVWVCIVVC